MLHLEYLALNYVNIATVKLVQLIILSPTNILNIIFFMPHLTAVNVF